MKAETEFTCDLCDAKDTSRHNLPLGWKQVNLTVEGWIHHDFDVCNKCYPKDAIYKPTNSMFRKIWDKVKEIKL